ncbi:MAG: hypothetical protein UX89_C0016G0019 [Parcubacteria group bacterium GW2011_GWA2_47_16]|nr:MAG: hypothetical protein UX89_C0016G0019 [Parcubacteria group bacterium GW2011_GWA2_47_16]
MIKRKKLFSRWGSYLVTLSMFISVSFAVVAPFFVPSEVFGQTPPYTKFLGYENGIAVYGLETPPTTSATNFRSLMAILQNIIDAVIPFLVGLAVMLVIYGIVGFISHAADEEKRTEAKNFIIWGIIGIFVMISIWGFVNILVKTFNLDPSANIATDRYGVARDAYGNVIDNTSAVLGTKPGTVIDLITRVNVIGARIIPFLISIAVFIVILGLVGYIRQGDNEEKRAQGKMFIIWGIVSIFVMLSIWGFVNILLGSFNLNNAVPNIEPLPLIP